MRSGRRLADPGDSRARPRRYAWLVAAILGLSLSVVLVTSDEFVAWGVTPAVWAFVGYSWGRWKSYSAGVEQIPVTVSLISLAIGVTMVLTAISANGDGKEGSLWALGLGYLTAACLVAMVPSRRQKASRDKTSG